MTMGLLHLKVPTPIDRVIRALIVRRAYKFLWNGVSSKEPYRFTEQ